MKVEAQTPSLSACKATQWDPEAILGLTNPDRGSFTCVGHAPSMRRRCRNPIARNSRDFVYGLLDLLALMGPNSRKFATLLEEVAYRSLCWRHGSQADDIVEKWEASIAALNLPTPKAKENTKQSKSRTKKSQSTGSSYTRYTDDYVKTEVEDCKQKEREQDRRRAQQDQQRKKKQEEQDKQDREKIQQERRDKEARERRQQEAQNRREQEAQKRREREQQEREQAVKERREWQQAWQNYVTKWAAFKEAKHEPSTVQQAQALIPWPLKSGRFGDLTAGHVRSFYREACPDAKTTEMFKTMQRESLKWHPDKMVNLYRNCAPGEADKLAIEMICRVVLELREEARAMRDR
ncbi:hypothetical protein V500_07219 [Pseudogymnoascus sp. VKM F-4518 (FW-2643)]|nr:hypothetical protein V500_07219 [Pseudogymnoascus sp. VKM F-4518 (FW-2643)]